MTFRPHPDVIPSTYDHRLLYLELSEPAEDLIEPCRVRSAAHLRMLLSFVLGVFVVDLH